MILGANRKVLSMRRFICTVVFASFWKLNLDKVIYIFTRLDKKRNYNSNLTKNWCSMMDLKSLSLKF